MEISKNEIEAALIGKMLAEGKDVFELKPEELLLTQDYKIYIGYGSTNSRMIVTLLKKDAVIIGSETIL